MMKKRIFFGLIAIGGLFFTACTSSEVKEESNSINIAEYESFGSKISTEQVFTVEEMNELYQGMQSGDSIEATFISNVEAVCQKKGCWMELTLNENEERSFVKFKDYDFFVPMDAEGAEAIVEGMAYKEEVSVEELQHYAFDAGKSEEEIALITEPEVKYTFVANGVLLKKKAL